jgi:hypothetical protein
MFLLVFFTRKWKISRPITLLGSTKLEFFFFFFDPSFVSLIEVLIYGIGVRYVEEQRGIAD